LSAHGAGSAPSAAGEARETVGVTATLPYLSAADVARALDYAGAVEALEAALRGGLDPEADLARSIVPVAGGELLVMPSAAGGTPAVKLVTIGGEPRIQGVCVVFDPDTLAPAAVVDGIALTNLRTAAVSALAVRRLVTPGARRLLVFGRGPQGHAHSAAIRAVVPTIDHVDVVGRDHGDVGGLVGAADVIVCATTARTPLFEGAQVAAHATVVAIGSHEPDAREVDAILVSRATLVVESRTSALREAGDLILAIAEGAIAPEDITTLAEDITPEPNRPRFFKSTGMAWEDAVVVGAIARAALGR
jgi:ornithine cyclodeaminase/alanine dehydrogenase-like protein (mu-crystallin family)